MNRITVFAFAILAAGTVASAQENAPTESAQPKPQVKTVVGCLSRSADTYVITGGAPGPQQFRITSGDTSSLKGKIGHTVKVVGAIGESDPAQVAAPPFNAGSTTGAGYKTIMAQRIEVVGSLCSNPGQEWDGDHK